jgi:hypothetical protein
MVLKPQLTIMNEIFKSKSNDRIKIMSKIFPVIIFLGMGAELITCAKIDEAEKSTSCDSSTYDRLIFNIVLSNPDYNCKGCFAGEPHNYEGMKKNILMKTKQVQDSSLGLILTLHSWTSYGGDFPMSIIHISNDEEFEYAFPFFDEYYYSQHPYEIQNERLQYEFMKNLTFDRHLNFVIGQLGWVNRDNRDNAARLITLVADSVLGLKEYHINDVDMFRREIEQEVKDSKIYRKLCADNLQANLEEIVKEARQDEIRLFGCRTGEFGFWKFRIDDSNKKLRIIVSFENNECYFVATQ